MERAILFSIFVSFTSILLLSNIVYADFDYSISTNPSTGQIIPVTAGNSTTVAISLNLLSGTTQPVTFSCSGLPSGATCSFSPSSCSPPCSSTATISTSSTTTPWTYTYVVINSSSGGIVHGLWYYNLQVLAPPPPPFDYSVSSNPPPGSVINVNAGDSATIAVTLTLTSGSTTPVSLLQCYNLPSGATCSFSPTSCNPTCSSTVTISTSSTMQSGIYSNLGFKIYGGGVQHDLGYYSLNVTGATPSFDFSSSLNPTSGTVTAGGSTTTTLSLSLISGSTTSVSFSCSPLPSGASCSFSPSACNPSCISPVTISTSSTLPAGTYYTTIGGSSGSNSSAPKLFRGVTYTLTVTSTATSCSSNSDCLTANVSGIGAWAGATFCDSTGLKLMQYKESPTCQSGICVFGTSTLAVKEDCSASGKICGFSTANGGQFQCVVQPSTTCTLNASITSACMCGPVSYEYYGSCCLDSSGKPYQYSQATCPTQTTTISPPSTNQTCPICASPTAWSSCNYNFTTSTNMQTRTNYKCDSNTNYQCQSYIETQSCTPTTTSCPKQPTASCSSDQYAKANYDSNGCITSYTCISSVTTSPATSGSTTAPTQTCPIFNTTELKLQCSYKGGVLITSQSVSGGCTYYECKYDNREINSNPISGYSSCPTADEIDNQIKKCDASNLNPSIVFEGGCKVVRCSQETKPVCSYVSDSVKETIGNECSSKGLPVVRSIDNNGCAFYKCSESPQIICDREISVESYKSCDSKGGEMIAKKDNQGCIVFAQCVARGDTKTISVSEVKEVPDTTVLLSIALKLEKLKIDLLKLSADSKEIANYYASIGSVDEERYKRVSSMLGTAADKVDEIKTKLNNNANTISADDLTEIKHDITYLKDVTLRDILYVMLSNSNDVKETLEASKTVAGKPISVEQLPSTVRSCDTDGSCFNEALRECKPVIFRPQGTQGPLITITGLKDDKCVLHVVMQSPDKIPQGYNIDNFYMDCSIKGFALGIKGPEDVIPNCEGPMASFAKSLGGSAVVSGQSFPPPEGGPGNCKDAKQCAIYCIDNYDDCKQWVKDHPAYGTLPSKEALMNLATGRIVFRR